MSNPAYQAARARASRERIIAAALKLFVERGFAPVKLQDIAAIAGVSTATLFKHFPRKEDMLDAAVATLATLDDEGAPGPAAAFSAESLRGVAMAYARRLDNPMMLGLIRLGITDAGRNPQLGPTVSEAWRGPFIKRLEVVLDQARDEGKLLIPDRAVATRQFFGMLTDALLWPRLLGLATETAPGYRAAVVDEAIKTFIARYRHPNTL